MGKRIRNLNVGATEEDLVAGNYFAVDTPEATKKLGADKVAGKSIVAKNKVVGLPFQSVDRFYTNNFTKTALPYTKEFTGTAWVFQTRILVYSKVRVVGNSTSDGKIYITTKVYGSSPNVYEIGNIESGAFDVSINFIDWYNNHPAFVPENAEYISLQINFGTSGSSDTTTAEITALYVSEDLDNYYRSFETKALESSVGNFATPVIEETKCILRTGEIVEIPIAYSGTFSNLLNFKLTPGSSFRIVGTANFRLQVYFLWFESGVAKSQFIESIAAGNFDYTLNISSKNVSAIFEAADNKFVYIIIIKRLDDPTENPEATISKFYVTQDIDLLFNEVLQKGDILALQNEVKKCYNVKDLKDYGFSPPSTLTGFQGWQSNQRNYMLTVKDSKASATGLLTKLEVRVLTAGKYRFFAAMIDQNGYISLATEPFDVVLSAGVNHVDVSSLGFAIEKDFQLFAFVDYFAVGTTQIGVPYRNMQSDTQYVDHEAMIATSLTDVVHRFNVAGGFVIDFYWEVEEYSSIFATKASVKEVAEKAEQNASAIASMEFITGKNGIRYKIGVDINGNLVLYPMEFSNAVCIGNSLTDHAPSPNIGYYGDGWPMAASCLETGWIYELQEVFRQKNPSAVVGKIGGTTISAFERFPENYVTDSDFDAVMGDYTQEDLDLIIYKAGENVSSGNVVNYKAGLKRFLNYLLRKYPTAQVFVAQPFYAGAAITNATFEAASESLVPYIPDTQSRNYRQKLGMFTFGDDDEEYPIIYSPVASHLDDIGFLLWTNALADYFGYAPLTWLKDVSISADPSIEYGINKAQGVKGGLYTILIYGALPQNISVTDESNNSVSYTTHDMSSVNWIDIPNPLPDYAITFVMPNSNVSVSLS